MIINLLFMYLFIIFFQKIMVYYSYCVALALCLWC